MDAAQMEESFSDSAWQDEVDYEAIQARRLLLEDDEYR